MQIPGYTKGMTKFLWGETISCSSVEPNPVSGVI
jgi:hypothetical protein